MGREPEIPGLPKKSTSRRHCTIAAVKRTSKIEEMTNVSLQASLSKNCRLLKSLQDLAYSSKHMRTSYSGGFSKWSSIAVLNWNVLAFKLWGMTALILLSLKRSKSGPLTLHVLESEILKYWLLQSQFAPLLTLSIHQHNRQLVFEYQYQLQCQRNVKKSRGALSNLAWNPGVLMLWCTCKNFF